MRCPNVGVKSGNISSFWCFFRNIPAELDKIVDANMFYVSPKKSARRGLMTEDIVA